MAARAQSRSITSFGQSIRGSARDTAATADAADALAVAICHAHHRVHHQTVARRIEALS